MSEIASVARVPVAAAAHPRPADLDDADPLRVQYREMRRAHWDDVAQRGPSALGGYYHRRLQHVYRTMVPPGLRVLELGSGTGDLLAALEPSAGVGVDLSGAMTAASARKYPHLTFVQADAHDPGVRGTFDIIIISDLLNDLWDAQQLLRSVRALSEPHTRVIMNFYSRVWELPLAAATRMGLATPRLQQNWFTVGDVANLLRLTGFEVVREFRDVLAPLGVPVLSDVVNRFVGRLWPFERLGLTNFIVARPLAPHDAASAARPPRVSVIVPARNEAGNVPAIFERTPEMGAGTELLFVEGHSTDGTYDAIAGAIAANPARRSRVLRQAGAGKGDAVRLGFAEATGEILMILDADLTVPPEDLPRFYEALVSGHAEFVNGVRLVYPMEGEAMRFANLLGNKFFSAAFSWLLGQSIKDTLCGTKVLWKRAYESIARNRRHFGDFDPFGDFDLLFGAARLNLRICDLPVRYRARRYGTTNIQRWRHGWLLLRMVAFAAGRIKFI